MNAYRILAFGLLISLTATGCRGWAWTRAAVPSNAPIAFTGPATMSDIVRVVNSNTSPIRQMRAEGATVTVSGYPPLRTTLEVERPRRFHMRSQLIGPELDLGSNDDLFWFWVKRNPQPAVFYAKHDQFARSNAHQILPIDPLWLVEAIGVVQLDPNAKFEGPFPATGKNQVQFRSKAQTAEGEQTKAYIVHDQYGWILEQHLYDARGQVLASARATAHKHYPTENVSMPHHVEIQIPSGQLSFSLNVSGYQFNNLTGDPQQLWTMPKFDGYSLVDLTDPNLRLNPQGAASPVAMPTSTAPQYGQPLNPGAQPLPLGAPPPNTTPYAPPQPNYRLNQRGAIPTVR